MIRNKRRRTSCGVRQKSKKPSIGRPFVVGSRPAGHYGLFDMVGNAEEWVADWYAPYPGNEVASEAYGEKFKVLRGGADFNGVIDYRTTSRFYLDPKTKTGGYAVGFRCAMDAR